MVVTNSMLRLLESLRTNRYFRRCCRRVSRSILQYIGFAIIIATITVTYLNPPDRPLINLIFGILGVVIACCSRLVKNDSGREERPENEEALLKYWKNFLTDVYTKSKPVRIEPGPTRGMDLADLTQLQELAYADQYGVEVKESLDFNLDGKAEDLLTTLNNTDNIPTYVDQMQSIWTVCMRLPLSSIAVIERVKPQMINEITRLRLMRRDQA